MNRLITLLSLLLLTSVLQAAPSDSTGRMPVTEGWVYRIDAVRPDFAPGEPGKANELCVILTSRYGASVDIEYYEESDVVMSQAVDIAPNAIEIICVPSLYAIEARSTAPFAVMSRQVFAGNGEQALHLPTSAWGTEYTPFSLWQDSYGINGVEPTVATARTVVIPIQPNTRVHVAYRDGHTDTLITTWLQPLVINEEVKPGLTRSSASDPTGVRISSASPISVVSGHAKGAILRFPDGLPASGQYARAASRSRGNLHDVMLPTFMAGTEFVTAPLLYTPTRERGLDQSEVGIENDRGDVIRFIALSDSTVISSVSASADMHVDTVLNAGDTWYAAAVEKATTWSASKPVMCAQYGKSYGNIISQATRPEDDPSVNTGLPLLQVVPPVDRWAQHAAFHAAVGMDNAVNVVCKSTDAENIRLDGRPVTVALRRHDIPGTPYTSFSGFISEGAHHVTAVNDAVRFCAWTYGSLDGLQLGRIYGSPAAFDMAQPCEDTLSTWLNYEGDSAVVGWTTGPENFPCAEIAFAVTEYCHGCTSRYRGNTMTIRRATPTTMVKASVLVVMRSGRFERRTVFMDGTTSVGESSHSNILRITPHPVQDHCWIMYADGAVIQGNVNVHSVTGECVRSVSALNETQLDLDLTDLPPGVYAVKIGSVRRMIIVE